MSDVNKTCFRLAVAGRQLGWCLAAIVMAPVALLPATLRTPEVSVNDPRPLNAAVKLIEHSCHCAITYEDPKWRPEELVDISGSIWHRPDVTPRIPNGGRFTFNLDTDVSSHTPAQMRALLAEVLRSYEATKSGPGTFQITADGGVLHVVPKSGSVLDAPLTFARESRQIVEVVSMALRLAGEAKGQKIGLATWPINLLQQPIEIEARHEPAIIILNRALASSGRKLSWRLFYDAGMAQYYLSIHFVP
jgi:hypothetical protein